MLPFKPLPHVSTYTLSRAYSVEPSKTSQPVEEAVADYDTSPSYGLAGFLLIPTVGLSALAYVQHHSIRTKDKIDQNYALAKEIARSLTIPLTENRYQVKAGDFLFTDVVVRNVTRVLVRKNTTLYLSSAIDLLEHPEKLEEEGFESKSSQPLSWEKNFLQWVLRKNNPAILIPGQLTVEDIQSRAENYIRIKAEEEACCYANSSVRAWNYQSDNNGSSDLRFALKRNIISEKRLIKMVGIYAVAQALLTPEEAASVSKDRYIYLQRHIVNNTESLNAIKRYFNFPRICNKRKNAYYDECREIAKRLRQFNAPDEPTNDLLNRTIEDAIDICFYTLKDLSQANANDLHI